MIDVTLISNVLEPERGRRSLGVEWTRGMRARDLAPVHWLGCCVFEIDGMRADGADEVGDGSRVLVVVAPKDVVTVITYVAVLVLSYVVTRALLPKPPRARDNNESTTYGFEGISSSRVEGEPMPGVYGEVRVGGQVINEYVESRGALGSFYNVVLSFGHGPLHRIVGQTAHTPTDQPMRSDSATFPIPRGYLWINETDAADIDGVEVHVRMGTLEQDPVQGFEFTSETVNVGTPLRGPDAEGDGSVEYVFANNNLVPWQSNNGASSDSLWVEYGEGVSMSSDQEADAFTIVTEFIVGLYRTNSAGNAVNWWASVAVRYIELDGSGTPIATGGPQGDGYVRLRPPPLIAATKTSNFTVDWRFPLYDPQTFTYGTLGKVLQLWSQSSGPGTSDAHAWLRNTAFVPLGIMDVQDNSKLAEFSFEFWAQLRPTDMDLVPGTGDSDLPETDLTENATVFDWTKTSVGGQRGGVRIALERRTFTIAPGHTRQRIVPVVRLYDNAGVELVQFEKQGDTGLPTGNFQLAQYRDTTAYALINRWRHTVVTYKPNAVGALTRLRVYVDGVQVHEYLGTFRAGFPLETLPLTGRICALCSLSQSATERFRGWLDEVVLFGGEMSPDDARRAYNGGYGRPAPTANVLNPNGTVRLFTEVRWSFDTSAGSGVGGGQTVPGYHQDVGAGVGYDLETVYSGAFGANAISFGTGGKIGFVEAAGSTNTVKRGRYRIEAMRALKEQDNVRRVDDQVWRDLILHTNDDLSYPEDALIAVRVPASSNLNGSVPNVTTRLFGRLVPVWDGASVTNPTFDRVYSDSPAWCLADVALSPTFGIGWTMRARDLDVQSLQDAADYYAEPVYDQRGRRLEFGDWTDLFYSPVLLGTSAGIQIRMPLANLPAHWRVGGYVAWYGTPAVTAGGGPFEDSNVADATEAGGYEIVSITDTSGVAFVNVRWLGALAPWNASTLLSTQITGALDGTIEGREKRFVTSWSLDTAGNAWDMLTELLVPARSVPVRVGRMLRVFVDRPREAVDMVGTAQVEPGSFQVTYESARTKMNAADVRFPDAAVNWERGLVPYEDPEVSASSNLSLIRRQSFQLDTAARRSQVLRHAAFLVFREKYVLRRGKFRASIDMVGYGPGDVLYLANDVMDRGVSGRLLADSADDTHVTLDRTVSIASGRSYVLIVRSAITGDGVPPMVVSVDESTTGLGAHAIGDTITLAEAMSTVGAKGDPFIFVETEKVLRVAIDSITTEPDLKRAIEFSQYDARAYAVEGVDIVPDFEDGFDAELTIASGPSTSPLAPRNVRAREARATGAGGVMVPALAVSWDPPEGTQPVGGFDVFVAVRDVALLGAPRDMNLPRAARVGPDERSALVLVDGCSPGDVVEVSVVAVSPLGTARPAPAGARASVRMAVRAPAPPAPSALATSMAGELAIYRFVPGSRSRALTHEIRIGGWILGQHVATLPNGASEFGPTPNWCSAANSITQRDAGPLYVRARSAGGSMSDVATVEWAPRAISTRSVDDLSANYSTSWEDFGDGWVFTAPTTPNAVLTDLVVNAANELEFTGSALTATYTMAEPDTEGTEEAEPFFVSAFAVAEQVHPLTWDECTATWDDCDQVTWEGPLDEVDDGEDVGRCTLDIQVRYLEGDFTWSGWRDYQPGRTTCVAAQFRIVLTRPSVDWNVRVSRFSTELLRAPDHRWSESPLEAMARARVLRRG